ncbi:peptidase domain-containing ABC transporter [Desulfohalovibrio reitneri]|uniref:peptidase domain-containing ABC transporter n=1 Tax=Desulfohalovibrio reitneri TaxID=1307759 RepID=UPI0004A6ADF8|nr:ABC transporter transmembrane domain-containing protein [Desulfohalovibrio reitneri]
MTVPAASPREHPPALPGRDTDLAACLLPLLDGLDWHGDSFSLLEAIPHLRDVESVHEFVLAMANLGYACRSRATSLARLEERDLPCLFVDGSSRPLVPLEHDEGGLLCFDGRTRTFETVSLRGRRGRVYVFEPLHEEDSPQAPQTKWLQRVMGRFRRPLGFVLVLSLLLSLLTLLTPFFIMLIFDQVLATDNPRTLAYVTIGVGIFIASGLGLRLVRASLLSFVGGRLGNIIGNEAVRRIFLLPPSMTRSASISSQINRMREFESIRDFVTGPGFAALVELPGVVILLLGLFLLGGSLALVPVAAIAVFAVLAGSLHPLVNRALERASAAHSKRSELLLEIVSKMRTIRQMGCEDVCLERFRARSAEAALASYRATQYMNLVTTLAHGVIMGAGMATLAFGVLGVLAGDVTTGAMLAAMILVWRVLAPIRSIFGVMMQARKATNSVGHVNRLMEMELEQRSGPDSHHHKPVRGEIEFSQVSVRSRQGEAPELLGVSFALPAGRMLAVIGHDGSGKSALMQSILGMIRPQAGRISLDGLPLMQNSPLLLRRSIGYAPQEPDVFYGTIGQNMRMAFPAATPEEIETALRRAGVLEEARALPEGMDTRLGDHKSARLPATTLHKLNLARALLKPATVFLIDETLDRLDMEGRQRAFEALREKRGRASVVLATNDKSIARRADLVLRLERGRVAAFGSPNQVLGLTSENIAG